MQLLCGVAVSRLRSALGKAELIVSCTWGEIYYKFHCTNAWKMPTDAHISGAKKQNVKPKIAKTSQIDAFVVGAKHKRRRKHQSFMKNSVQFFSSGHEPSLLLSAGVDGGSCLVQQQHSGLAQDHPRQANELSFAKAQVAA